MQIFFFICNENKTSSAVFKQPYCIVNMFFSSIKVGHTRYRSEGSKNENEYIHIHIRLDCPNVLIKKVAKKKKIFGN